MKRLACFLVILLCALSINAQKTNHRVSGQKKTEANHADYKQIVSQILKDDELFVLFYMDLALVVDPMQESQVVEPITTENPWESIEKYISSKSNIYFCPSGNQLGKAIEYMPCPIDPSVLMSDQYAMYRLSSPEELFKNRGESFRNTQHKAVVFGGLKYDEQTTKINGDELAFRGQRKAVGYNYLKSTYDEAIYIDSIFRKNNITTALLTGKDGTERRFAQISNSNIDILHIASHGFYEPDIDNSESASLQEWMMSHSGLILAGAEYGSDNRSEDGLLTAYEISQTDLSGVNLVVLSACNTGLGDVKENDVYGLLKGFKKAGAGTLMVSLSEVNDTITYLLMKRFYDNLFRGDNPRRALENAQRYIRLIGNGQFNKPECWAAFILVDDLDRNIGQNVSDEYRTAFLSNILEVDHIYSENYLFPNWSVVQQKIIPDDIVIRFCPYVVGEDVVDYVAMISDPLDGHCNIVRLFSINNNKLGPYPVDNNLYEIPFDYMDSILWRPLLPFLSRKKRIYCQPAGVISNFPYEYLPSVVNKYALYRLSSIEVLYDSYVCDSINEKSTAALFGGLYYDISENSKGTNPGYPLDRGAVFEIPYLPGTKMETDEIAQILENYGMRFWLYQGNLGTEDVLKRFSGGKETKIIHIATHALSYDSTRASSSLANSILNNSAILFSGAASFIRGELYENITEDGVLFGGEVALLDFSTTSLLTLSTCHPIIRKNIISNYTDSPWDLVKAFKMSGVHTILFALWNVDDQSTALLMTSFYKHLLNGCTKQESLRKAIGEIQSHTEKGWDDPRYWASFVLIDALD